MEKAKSNRVVYISIGTFIILLVVYKPFTYNKLPMKTGLNFAVMEKLTSWLKETPFKKNRNNISNGGIIFGNNRL